MRKVKQILRAKPTMEGAGVRLKRAFGFNEVPLFDPFLLLDDFHSENPQDYIAGFPWHPHRGIETVTYMLHGAMNHEDSMGNSGVIRNGDVQWMTAGSGIIHSEMPGQSSGLLWGFQLWVNLPASAKMTGPRYRGIIADQIPEVADRDGARVRIICGEFSGTRGPARDIIAEPEYLDVSADPESLFSRATKPDHNVFAYVYDGSGLFDGEHRAAAGDVVLYGPGDAVEIRSGADSLRFLFLSGRPIGEPVAWYGPIVMNTESELEIAFDEYRKGTFIKH